MTTQSFTLALEGPGIVENDALLDRLYDAGCSDASFGERGGHAYADFDRDADTLSDAIVSAIDQVESVPGLKVRRVDEQDLVSPSDIADRIGRSRQSIWQLANGARGGGDFPPPAATIGSDRSLWRWSDVADWFARRGELTEAAAERTHVIGAVNGYLNARNHLDHIGDLAARLRVGHLVATDVRLSFGLRIATIDVRADLTTRRALIATCTIPATDAVSAETLKEPKRNAKPGVSSYACAA
jgi:predicted DNA-binding transcriptional regulator AlpA